MNHLIQVARRTGKPATGYKVQLVIHRMTAHLPASYDGVELCAVITRHKKRVMTKCACYLADKREVVWGDILPFTTTLYLAKTGLYQAKAFNIQVFDTRTDHQIASFEFNLAELVQSNKDSSKESLMVPAIKCHDPRASLSLTAITMKATSKSPRMPGEPEGSNADEMSFDGSQSDMSVITLESKSSRVSMASASRHGRSHGGGLTSPANGGGGDNGAKTDGTRGAFPVGVGVGEANDAIEMYGLRSKHQELLRSVQDLEDQLRQSEGENVKLEKKMSEKDQLIQKLQSEKDDLESQLQAASDGGSRTSSSSSSFKSGGDGGNRQVDSVKYIAVVEEKQQLQRQLDEMKEEMRLVDEQRKLDAIPPLHVTVNAVKDDSNEDAADSNSDSSSDDSEQEEAQEEEEEEEEERGKDDKRSEASSANEYLDAHDTQLVAEINDLKVTVKTMMNERDHQHSMIKDLTKAKDQLTVQIRGLEGKITALEATIVTLERENDLKQERIDHEEQEKRRRTTEFDEEQGEMDRRYRAESTEVKQENERLVEQLSHLDHLVTQLKDEKDALARKLVQAESSQDRAQKDMQDAHEAIGQLTGSNYEISEKLQVAHEASQRAQQEIVSAQSTIEELREQVRDISERLQSTQAELENLRDGELASSAAAAAAAIAKNQELQERWDDLKLQNEQLQSRVDELEERLANTEASGEEREVDLQRQVEELKQESAQLREELEELRASKQQAEEELHDRASELKQLLETQQRQSSDHAQQVGELHMEKEDAQSRTTEETRAKEAIEQEMKRRLAELEQENDYFQGELIDSKMKLAELNAKNEELSSQNHRVEKNLIELKAKAAAAEAVLAGKKK